MGNYLNPDNGKFEEAVNSSVYIDKTGLIEYTNSVLHTMQDNVCVSRPNRFARRDIVSAWKSTKGICCWWE